MRTPGYTNEKSDRSHMLLCRHDFSKVHDTLSGVRTVLFKCGKRPITHNNQTGISVISQM